MADITVTLTAEEITAWEEMLNVQSGETLADKLETYLKNISSTHIRNKAIDDAIAEIDS